MSQRRRFFEALSLLVCIEDWTALEYVEDILERKRGDILSQFLAEHDCRRCLSLRSPRYRIFEVAFSPQIARVIE